VLAGARLALSKLDTFIVNGQRLRDLTAGEARGAIRARRAMRRFLEMARRLGHDAVIGSIATMRRLTCIGSKPTRK